MPSTDQSDVPEGNKANFGECEVLISRTVLGQAGWRRNSRGGNSIVDDCSCIIDTGFNGGALCSLTGCVDTRNI